MDESRVGSVSGCRLERAAPVKGLQTAGGVDQLPSRDLIPFASSSNLILLAMPLSTLTINYSTILLLCRNNFRSINIIYYLHEGSIDIPNGLSAVHIWPWSCLTSSSRNARAATTAAPSFTCESLMHATSTAFLRAFRSTTGDGDRIRLAEGT